MTDAECAGLPVEIFYPARGSNATDAKAVCSRCQVRADCHDHATATGERHGWWGGESFNKGGAYGDAVTLRCHECDGLFDHELQSQGGARPAYCSDWCRRVARRRQSQESRLSSEETA